MKKKLCLLSIIAAASLSVLTAVGGEKLTDRFSQAFSTEAEAALLEQNGITYDLADGGIEVTDTIATTTSDIVIPESVSGYTVVSISAGAFNNNPKVKSVVLPETVKFIGGGAFMGCTNLESIELPSSIDAIWDNTFFNCVNLREINIPDSVVEIGSYAFNGCKSLESVTLPPNLKVLEMGVFKNCSSLKEIELPKTVSAIGSQAFEECISLASVNIPGTVDYSAFDYSEFTGCSALKTATFGSDAPELNPFLMSDAAGVTIYYIEGKKGWSAIKADPEGNNWFMANDYTFVARSASEVLTKGDVDTNGIVNAADAAVMLKKITNPSLVTPIESVNGENYLNFVDINGDGKLTILDPIKLLKNNGINVSSN